MKLQSQNKFFELKKEENKTSTKIAAIIFMIVTKRIAILNGWKYCSCMLSVARWKARRVLECAKSAFDDISSSSGAISLIISRESDELVEVWPEDPCDLVFDKLPDIWPFFLIVFWSNLPLKST